MKFIIYLYRLITSLLIRPLLWHEYRKPLFLSPNERSLEFEFVFACINRIRPKTILDVGSGMGTLPSIMANCGIKVTSTDLGKWHFNHHFHTLKDDITDTRLTGKYDLVTCISVLEHIKDYKKALANLLNLGEYVILTFPFHDPQIEDVYSGERKYFTRAFSPEIYQGLKIHDMKTYKCWSGDYWGQGERITHGKGYPDLICLLIQSK